MNGNGIHGLRKRIKEFMNADRFSGFVSDSKIIPLKHPCYCILACKTNDICKTHLVEPIGIVLHRQSFTGEYLLCLFKIRLAILMCLFKRKGRAGFTLAGWVADHTGKIAYDKYCLMAEILKLPKFAQYN